MHKCIRLWYVTLLRDRMVLSVSWWNQRWVLDGTTTPIATPPLYENSREPEAEHTLVEAYVS